MSMHNVSRREFLKASAAAGAGLTLGFFVGDAPAQAPAAGAAAAAFEPNAFLRIGRDNTVTVVSKHLEMGQGIFTGLATLAADELDAAWSQVRVVGAPADAQRFGNLKWNGVQGTGGSDSIANAHEQYRRAGAAARAMLVAAAAERWKVPAESISVKNGVVFHAGGRKATFGELAEAAAKQPVPAGPKLKDAKDFVFVGKHVPRVDTRAKSSGTATFTQDVKLPEMLTAVVAHPPRFGARVKRIDAAGLKDVPGVRYVVEVPNGVAVLAAGFWTAQRGRAALKVEWDDSDAFRGSSTDVSAELRRLAGTPGKAVRNDGDAAKAQASAAKTLESTCEVPYLAHAAMEPMDCVVKLDADRCEIWNGEQGQTDDQAAVAKLLGMKPEQVTLNMLYAGGSFGRRINPSSDFVLEAASIAKALAAQGKTGVPVKLVWTREDDMRAGQYRPAAVHALKAGLDASGAVVGWQHRVVAQSLLAGTVQEALLKGNPDGSIFEGATTLPYDIADVHVEFHAPPMGVPVAWWRSVGHSHTAFAIETFVDELAAAAGKDPVAFRKAMLGSKPRHAEVLDLVAQKAGWGTPLPAAKAAGAKRGRGIAIHEARGTVVAQVVEATVASDGKFTVDRVVCALDCGLVVNPDNVRAQMEGGIGFALSAALYGAITLRDGVVEQSNFHDYRVLRINEMPAVDVHIVASAEPPTGVGEVSVPPLAPALANALAAATGKRLRKLPLSLA